MGGLAESMDAWFSYRKLAHKRVVEIAVLFSVPWLLFEAISINQSIRIFLSSLSNRTSLPQSHVEGKCKNSKKEQCEDMIGETNEIYVFYEKWVMLVTLLRPTAERFMS